MDAPAEFLAAALRIATPLLFAALGGILSERAGVFGVGLEGMMLAGAFAGVIATYVAGHAGVGLLASAAGGAALAAVVALATVRFCADQMVTGLAVNILALGLTSFLLRGLFGRGQAPTIRVTPLAPAPIPGAGRHARARPPAFPPARAHLRGRLIARRGDVRLLRDPRGPHAARGRREPRPRRSPAAPIRAACGRWP